MAVQSNGSNESQRRKHGSIVTSVLGGHYLLKKAVRMIGSVIIIIIFLMLIFGFINQRATGQSIMDWSLQVGHDIGTGLLKVFNGDEDAPIDVTDQGIYVDGHSPDDANDIFPGKSGNEE